MEPQEGIGSIDKMSTALRCFRLLWVAAAERGRCTGAMLVLAAMLVAGCSSIVSPAHPGSEAGRPQVKRTIPVVTSTPVAACPTDVSSKAVAYATALHGKSHLGETLYLVVVTEDACESVVTHRLEELRPHLGDTGSLFIVMESGWFQELVAGRFILAEAHPTAKSAQEASEWFAGRTDASWYWPVVQKVAVMTTSPIPVLSVDSY